MKDGIAVGDQIFGHGAVSNAPCTWTVLRVFKANKKLKMKAVFTRLDGTTYGYEAVISFSKWLERKKV